MKTREERREKIARGNPRRGEDCARRARRWRRKREEDCEEEAERERELENASVRAEG